MRSYDQLMRDMRNVVGPFRLSQNLRDAAALSAAYQRGYEQGKSDGYDRGYAAGIDDDQFVGGVVRLAGLK